MSTTTQNKRIVLGIDPGYERMGVSIILKEEFKKEELLFSSCIQTSSKENHAERLGQINKKVCEIIKKYKPNILSIETLFFNKNPKTAMLVAESRGVVLSLASLNKLKVFEYSPLQIKSAVTGYGRGDKKSIARLVPLLIKINKKIKFDDEYDAIATGLTYLAFQKK
jgi:crossover junction endodeoxyribonuclease RuvC